MWGELMIDSDQFILSKVNKTLEGMSKIDCIIRCMKDISLCLAMVQAKLVSGESYKIYFKIIDDLIQTSEKNINELKEIIEEIRR